MATPQGVQGLLGNLEHSGYVPTTTTTGDRLLNLLTLPRQGRAVIVDPTGGTGDLLRPFDGPNVDRICIEISRERAEAAQRALLDAQVINAAFEDCDLAVESISIGVANPPYFRQGTLRAEYLIIRLLTQAIMPDGILIAIIPARSAWDGVMINHVVRHYTDVQIFTVPSDEFERYTQIVVVGKKRALALEHPDPLQKDRLRAYRYKHDPQHPERSPWAAGTPPPELPTAPLLTPYRVPAAKDQPNITVRRAGETLVLRGMEASGVQHTTEWIAATTWQPDVALDQPIMPISGLAHQSALIMTDMFAGEAFQGPDGQWYTFLAHVGMEWTTVDPEDDEKAKGVTHIDQQQDHMTLSVLNLDTGDITHYQKDAVFEFLAPWLPILAERVLARYRPLYDLNPPDWLLDVACQIGLDKALPGADEPGLAIPQLHRVFAMWYALCAKGYVAMQGEPGTGKSRMHTLLMAIFAYAWANRSRLFTRATRPKWIDKLRRAWRAAAGRHAQARDAGVGRRDHRRLGRDRLAGRTPNQVARHRGHGHRHAPRHRPLDAALRTQQRPGRHRDRLAVVDACFRTRVAASGHRKTTGGECSRSEPGRRRARRADHRGRPCRWLPRPNILQSDHDNQLHSTLLLPGLRRTSARRPAQCQ